MIYGILYSVFLDGKFVGVCEEEDMAWEVAQNYLNGEDTLYDDDVDRVWYHKIDVNRWHMVANQYNCSDKLSKDNIMCKNKDETEKCIRILNKFSLQEEREQAKKRAMAL